MWNIILLLIIYCDVFLAFNINLQLLSEDVAVKGLERQEYYVYLTNTSCVVTDSPLAELSPYFATKDLIINSQSCLGEQITQLLVPDSIINKWKPDFINNEKNFESRICYIKEVCTFLISFIINRPTTQDKAPNKSMSTLNADTKNSYIWVYVGIGGAVVILIVIIQTACIISYSRKVVYTRRALEHIMHRGEDRREANERYSVGPVSKKMTIKHTKEENNLYASLEHLAIAAVEEYENTLRSNTIKDRPPLPLPHEMPPPGREDVEGEIKLNRIKKLPIPLPHEIPRTRYNVKTLPNKATTQIESSEISPELPINVTMTTLRVPSKVPQSFPVNTLPHRNTSQQGPSKIRPKPPIKASMALLRPLPHKNTLQEGPSERFPEVPIKATKTSLRVAPSVPTTEHLSNSRPLLNRMVSTPNIARQNVTNNFQHVPLHHANSEMNERRDSSDEEWTYEKLPPIKNYLR